MWSIKWSVNKLANLFCDKTSFLGMCVCVSQGSFVVLLSFYGGSLFISWFYFLYVPIWDFYFLYVPLLILGAHPFSESKISPALSSILYDVACKHKE